MGWNGAGDIFDAVATTLINARATDEVKTKVVTTLAWELRDGDWDTEDESLEAFRYDPAIVEGFRQLGGERIENCLERLGL